MLASRQFVVSCNLHGQLVVRNRGATLTLRAAVIISLASATRLKTRRSVPFEECLPRPLKNMGRNVRKWKRTLKFKDHQHHEQTSSFLITRLSALFWCRAFAGVILSCLQVLSLQKLPDLLYASHVRRATNTGVQKLEKRDNSIHRIAQVPYRTLRYGKHLAFASSKHRRSFKLIRPIL